jgi:hypothetical protein
MSIPSDGRFTPAAAAPVGLPAAGRPSLPGGSDGALLAAALIALGGIVALAREVAAASARLV